ncbi:preprotein translocase subunit SecE [Coprothermobacteraceae bacterium]|nr:preprotein translocase subunit SecE [Coprothermobacteraceae bacterium]
MAERKGIVVRIKEYFRSARVEMQKVAWPSRQQITNAAIAVLVFSGVWAVLITIFDFLFSRALPLLVR